MLNQSVWDAVNTEHPSLEAVKVHLISRLILVASCLLMMPSYKKISAVINPQLQIAKSLPRICLLSGLSGEEMMMFIDAFPETGTDQSLFS